MAQSRFITDIDVNKFYDRDQHFYDKALLTRCYTQHALQLYIDFCQNSVCQQRD